MPEAHRGTAVQDRIVDAAREVLRSHGVHHTRMDDIAVAAGVARPNIYRYFPNRESLVLEVLVAEIRAANEERRQVIPVIGPVCDLLVESLALGAERARADELLTSTLRDGLDVTARIIGGDRRIIDVELEYWAPLLAHGRARREILPQLSDERIIRWFMAFHFLSASRPELLNGDVRAWIADFVVPPLLLPEPPRWRH
jgi:AcrR family transcriptional regulator